MDSSPSSIKFNLFHIVISSEHSSFNKFSQSWLLNIVSQYKSIVDWAYILHDKDKYTKVDEEENPSHMEGYPKPPHYHIIIRVANNNWVFLRSVASWFSVPENLVSKPHKGGVLGFNILLSYFTHTSEECINQGKVQYSVNEIKSNIPDLSERIGKIFHNREYKDILTRSKILAYEGLYSPNEIRDMFNISKSNDKFMKIISEQARLGEINRKRDLIVKMNRIKLPSERINIYFYGEGGVGKTFLCDALAYSLYPDMELGERRFNTSSKASTVKEYSGQPVIVWDECRGDKLLEDTGGQGNLLKIFRTHPIRESVDVKFGSVTLLNKYNFVNSPEPFELFISKISEGDNQSQYYRRFPIYISVGYSSFSVYINDRIYGESKNYLNYSNKLTLNICVDELMEDLEYMEAIEGCRDVFEKRGLLDLISKVEYFLSSSKSNSIERKIMALERIGASPSRVLGKDAVKE